MTFKEMQDEVLNHGFPEGYRNRVKNWLNEAQSRITRIFELPQLYKTTTIQTISGTDLYDVSGTNIIRLNGITNASSPSELTFVDDPADLVYQNQAGQNMGEPQYYSLEGSSIRLSPVPDTVYTLAVDFYGAASPLTGDTNISDIPSDYHDVMISYALSKAYRSEDDPQMSQFFYSEFQRDLQYLGADLQSTVRDGPRQVPGMWNI